MAARVISPKCFFIAWIFAWVVAVYPPSAAIALARLSPLTNDQGFLAATLAVADDVSPAAKIGFALLLALLLLAARRLPTLGRKSTLVPDVAAACLAMFLVIALLPAEWSRGFGVGLSGDRFGTEVTLIYLVSAAASGLTFRRSEAKCLRRLKRTSDGLHVSGGS
jgi:hypothetical protein